MKITKRQLRKIIKEELEGVLREDISIRAPWNTGMNLPKPARDEWYKEKGGEEVAQEKHYNKLIEKIKRWFADDEKQAKEFLSDMFARGFSTAAEEHHLGADTQHQIEKVIIEAGYLSTDGSTKQPWEK